MWPEVSQKRVKLSGERNHNLTLKLVALCIKKIKQRSFKFLSIIFRSHAHVKPILTLSLQFKDFDLRGRM